MVNPTGTGKSYVKTVYNKLLGGWYNVRGPHQTPIGGRYNSKEEALAALRGKNPVRPLANAETRARKLFENFTGMDGAVIEVINVPALPKAVAIIGELDFVGYTTVRESVTERYKHAFRKQSRPLLCVSHDGKSLYIVGGRYHFTERGIEDR
jgi:hypothetical protein